MNASDLTIDKLGECKVHTPMHQSVYIDDDLDRIIFTDNLKELKPFIEASGEMPCFEMAGPREKIYFDPSRISCGIVTCGGLCPGINDVIRT